MMAISHLLPAPFTQQVVLALLEAGEEARFFTTLTPDGPDWAAWALRLAGAGRSRALRDIPPGVTETYPWREVARLALGRVSRDELLRDRVFHWGRDGFDAWVARRTRPPFRLVYGYETECLETFRAARAHGIRTAYDLPSPDHDFVEGLLRLEGERFPELRTPARQRFEELQSERTARRHEEFRLADVVCANSQFTKSTWAAAGLDATKIVTLPLGAPEPDETGRDGGTRGRGPVRLVWAGTFSVRKGAHYLLEAWGAWAAGRNATLDVFGSVSLPASLRVEAAPGITFHGPVPRERVLAAFKESDALVFPTLCDGFGLVVNEALSRGLPVITTRRAGAADLIRDGENGRLIEHASVPALVEVLDWCATHRGELRAMRPVALATAAAWQWKHYRAALRDALLASASPPSRPAAMVTVTEGG